MKTLLPLLLIIQILQASEFNKLSGIHDSVNTSLCNFVEKNGFGKVTYYYDNVNQKDGKWELYPSFQISNSIFAVNVSKIPGRPSEYSFIIIIDTTSWTVTDTLGPYFDSYVSGIALKLEMNKIVELKVLLDNPPEPNEEKNTIVKYDRITSKLSNVKNTENIKEDDLYKIYSAVIEKQFPYEIFERKQDYLVFFKKSFLDTLESITLIKTVAIDTVGIKYLKSSIDSEILEQYFMNPRFPSIIEAKLNCKIKVNLTDRFNNNLSTFQKNTYGVLRFAQIGLNKNGTKALVSYDFHCDTSLCGGYYYVTLEKKNDNWVVIEVYCTLKY